MPETSFTELKGISTVLCMMLPVHMMYPNGTTGAWSECYKDPDKVRMLNAFLWLMAAADAALVTVYIESIPDYSLMAKGAVTIVRFYRLLVPLTDVDARAIIMHMAAMLTPNTDAEKLDARAAKRTKTKPANTAYTPRDSLGNPIQVHHMINTRLDYQCIDSEAAFLQFFATSTAGLLRPIADIDYTCPPVNASNGDGNLSDDLSDDDDDGVEEEDRQSSFDAWYAALPRNNILKMLDIDIHFTTGTRAFKGIHSDQLDVSKYFSRGTFKFPDLCIQHELVLRIGATAPFIGKNPNNLIGNFLLPGATLGSMTADELLSKIQTMAQIVGEEVPEAYFTMNFDELRKAWRESSGSGQDHSYFSPIQMEAPENRVSTHATQSDLHLAEIYPPMGHMKMRISDKEFRDMLKALENNVITVEEMSAWRTDVIHRILQFWSGETQEGFVQAYFKLRAESLALINRLLRKNDAVTREARRFMETLNKGNMNAINSRIAVASDLLRGPMHQTPPQASAVLLVWITSFVTYLPEIGDLQPTFILKGPHSTGKSKLMDTIHQMITMTSRIRQDMRSKKSMTANVRLGVVKIDEWKIGVNNDNEVDYLTCMSTGMCDYDRFNLGKNGDPSFNAHIKSDQRGCTMSASNDPIPARVAARVQRITVSGMPIEGARGPEEFATLDDDMVDSRACFLFFQTLFAHHTSVHLVRQCLKYDVCKAYFPVWFAITSKVSGDAFKPGPREVTSLKFISHGVMLLRLVTEYQDPNRTSTAPTFDEFVMANAVTTMYDYCLAYTMLKTNTNMLTEECAVVVALKSSLILAEGAEEKLELYESDYYVTGLKTISEVMARCPGKMSQASGLVTDVLKTLSSGAGKGQEPLLVTVSKKSDQNYGHYAVHKDLISPPTLTSLLPTQVTILKFLAENVIGEKQIGEKPAMWHISLDEQYVVFKKAILDSLIRPYLADQRFRNCGHLKSPEMSNLAVVKKSLLLFEAAGIMEYRVPDMIPNDLEGEGSILSDTGSENDTLVTLGGPLDPGRILPGYLDDDNANDDNWRQQKAQEIGCVSVPAKRKYKRPLRIMSCLKVRSDILKDALLSYERQKHGLDEEIKFNAATGNHTINCDAMWDATMAVSGEYLPGDVVCKGPCPKSAKKYATYEIKPIIDDTIKVKNPRYRPNCVADVDKSIEDTSVDAQLLDASKQYIDFNCYNFDNDEKPLTVTIKEALAKKNGVPLSYCNL